MKRVLSLFMIVILSISLSLSSHVDAATLKLNKSKTTLNVGSAFKLKLGKLNASKVSWSSSKRSVASVNKGGIITAKSKGKTTITAKYNKKSYTCIITVKAKDYSDWVEYSTGNIDNLIDGMLNGDIVYINGKYYCSPEYFEMITNEEIIYENDISTTNAINQHTLDPDTEIIWEDNSDESNADDDAALQDRINRILNEGVSSASSSD